MSRYRFLGRPLVAAAFAGAAGLALVGAAGTAQAQTNPYCQYGPYYNPALCPVYPPGDYSSYSYSYTYPGYSYTYPDYSYTYPDYSYSYPYSYDYSNYPYDTYYDYGYYPGVAVGFGFGGRGFHHAEHFRGFSGGGVSHGAGGFHAGGFGGGHGGGGHGGGGHGSHH